MLNDKKKAEKFFTNVLEDELSDVVVIIVTHVVPGIEPFIQAIAKVARIVGIIPKPRSLDPVTMLDLSMHYNIMRLNRAGCENSALITAKIGEIVQPEEKFILMDMGGYFARSFSYIAEHSKAEFLGIIEGTENGHKRYERSPILPRPVFSVARSPLKESEDFLVGCAIIFSTEALLRQIGIIMINKKVLVLGYGKIGQSIADAISRRHAKTMVYDVDPIREVQAFAHGFDLENRERSLADADIVFCATGNKALQNEDFFYLKNGCFVVCATSPDDELDIEALATRYEKSDYSQHVQRYSNGEKYFYLLNDGNAVNFVHHGVVGPYIYLVQAELAKCIEVLAQKEFSSELHTLSKQEKTSIATKWLQTYNGGY